MRTVLIIDCEVVTLPFPPPRRVVLDLCAHCGSDISVCGETLCRVAPDDPRCNGTTEGHEPDVLPQGMTFHAGELGDAYAAGANDVRMSVRPVSDELVSRSRDAYVKLAHLRRVGGGDA